MEWRSVSPRIVRVLKEWMPRRRFKREEWHRWFAWYPIKYQDSTLWLELVYRRRYASRWLYHKAKKEGKG